MQQFWYFMLHCIQARNKYCSIFSIYANIWRGNAYFSILTIEYITLRLYMVPCTIIHPSLICLYNFIMFLLCCSIVHHKVSFECLVIFSTPQAHYNTILNMLNGCFKGQSHIQKHPKKVTHNLINWRLVMICGEFSCCENGSYRVATAWQHLKHRCPTIVEYL